MVYTVKELPKSEQPREKLKKNDISSLTEVELLSLILRSGISGKNVKQLSSEIFNNYSLKNLSSRPIEELKQIKGVSEVKAGQLKAISELSKRLKKDTGMRIENLGDVKSAVMDLKFENREYLRIFYLSSSREIIKKKNIEGGLKGVEFLPRKILRPAVMKDSTAIILAHNHPSGKSKPTEQDLKSTKTILESGEKLGVSVLDHVIVGDNISSMRASTDLNFH